MSVIEKFVKLVTTTMDSATGDSESFQDVMHRNSLTLTDVVIVVLYLVVIFMFGKYLWNNVACPHITFMKPLSSVWQLLGISLLFQLFF